VYGVVYIVRNRDNGKIYVGQTTQGLDRRWRSHVEHSRGKSTGHLQRAIRKYGAEGFSIEILHTAMSQEELDVLEELAIATRGCTNRRVGYNLRSGGNGGKHSEETKKLWSKNRAGRKLPPEWCANMSRGKKGKKIHSVERRAQMSLQMMGNQYGKGRVASAETRAKMSGRPMPEHVKAILKEAHKKVDFSGENNSFYGRHHSEESLEKMRNKVVSAETRIKQGQRQIGDKNCKFRHDVPTEKMVQMYSEGYSTNKIGALVGMNGSSVFLRLKVAGVAFRKGKYKSK